MIKASNPFRVFYELDGQPLDNGYLYFGQPSQDPETTPISVFWDAAGTQPAPQPLRTQNGYIVRNGTPASVFVAATPYSMTVRDHAAQLVFYESTLGGDYVYSFNGRVGDVTLQQSDITALGFALGGAQLASIAVLRASTGQTGSVYTQGYYVPGDGGGSEYFLDSTDTTSPDNGGAVIVDASGGRWKLAKTGEFSVRQFGAKGDSTIAVPGTDDTAALQRFFDYLSGIGGAGYIPHGRYRTTARITIGNCAQVRGDGWKDVRDMTGPTTRDWAQSQVVGTIIYGDFISSVGSPDIFYVTGNSVTIRDMEFEARQPLPGPGWVSNNTPFALNYYRVPFNEQGGNSPLVENVMLRNFKDGIQMIQAFRGTFRHIYGQCFGNAISVTQNYDVLNLEDIRLNWPFYSGQADVVSYMDANAQAILLGRVDNPIMADIFVFGGRAGMKTYIDTTAGAGGKTERMQMSNIGFDNVAVGMDLEDAVTIDVSNFYVFCRNVANSRCIYSHQVLGGGQVPIRMNLVNGDFQGAQAEAMRFEVPGNVQMTNVRVRDYGGAGTAPGIAAYTGVNIRGSAVVFENTGSTPNTQTFGTGTINLSGGGGGGGGPLFAATIQSTATTTPASGTSLELNYDPTFSAGFVVAYDRTANIYKGLNLAGSSIGFKTGTSGANNSSFDSSGKLLVNYGTSQGAYQLQVNGAGLFSGDVTGVTATTGANDTRFATTAFVQSAISAGPTGSPDYIATIRSRGSTVYPSGKGVEMNYDTGLDAGFLISYDHGTAAYKDINLAGATVTFKSGAAGANQGFFDTNGFLILGYGTSQGSYKLQVNGQALFGSAVFAPTASVGTNNTQVATTAFVAAAVSASGVSSFNTRTGAVTLNSTDVNNAGGALKAGTTFTGLVDTATIRSTTTTAPGSGTGIEMNYDTGLDAGFLISYNHSASVYKNLNIGGATITFKSGTTGVNAGFFDTNQSLLIGYGSTNGSTYKLQVNSQIFAANATIATSDARVKQNVSSLEDGALDLVDRLRPVAFDFKRHDRHNFAENRQVGFLAQEVEAVLSEQDYAGCVVHTNDDGAENLKGIADAKLIPLLVKSIQELRLEVATLRSLVYSK